MRLSLLLLMSGALVIGGAAGASVGCDFYQDIAAGQSFKIFSPNYPSKYPNRADCRWVAVAPTDSKFILNCSEFSLPQVSKMQNFLSVYLGLPKLFLNTSLQ
jgi:hypothetical protein